MGKRSAVEIDVQLGKMIHEKFEIVLNTPNDAFHNLKCLVICQKKVIYVLHITAQQVFIHPRGGSMY